MRVTDEMVERAVETIAEQPQTLGSWQAMRAALTAALADVPEPAGPAEALAEGFAAMVRQQQARIADLEAKLGSVRALANEWEQRAADFVKRREILLSRTWQIAIAELRQRVEGK